MNKYYYLLPILFFWLAGYTQIPPTIQWEKNFGGSGIDIPHSIRHTTDGGFIVTGWTGSNNGDVSDGPNNGLYQLWVVKLDVNGSLLWEKTYGGSGGDVGFDIRQTNDGGYIVAGWTTSNDGDVSDGPNNGESELWVLKLDSFGNLMWEDTYGGSDGEVAHTIQQTSDGGYIVAGRTKSGNGDVGSTHGELDGWVLKLNATGLLVWETTYGGSDHDEITDIQQTSDGGYIAGGLSYSNDGDLSQNQGGSDAWVFKLSANGTITWSKSLGGSNNDEIGMGVTTQSYGKDAIQQTSDGGYIMAAHTYSNDGDVVLNQGLVDVWVLKFDANGNLSWKKTYGGTSDDLGVAIQETLDGNYIIAAQTYSNNGDVSQNQGIWDFWVVKIDPIGNLLWEQTYGGSSSDFLYAIQQVSDCEFILLGHSKSSDGDVGGNKGAEDFWVVKLKMQWPPPTVASPQNFCWAEKATLADLNATGNGAPPNFPLTLTWYNDNLKTNILPETTILDDGEKYYVTQTIDGCESPMDSVLVHINDPLPTVLSPQSFCRNEQVFISDLAVTGQNLNWYADSTGDTQLPVSTALEDGKTYYVTQTLNNCESSPLPVEIVIINLPIVDLSEYDGMAICWDADLSTPVKGGNYTPVVLETGLNENEYDFAWTLNGNALSETGPSLEAAEPGKYKVTVSGTDGVSTTCASTSTATIVEANPPEFNLSRTSGFVASGHGILVSNVTGIGNFVFRLDDGEWFSLRESGTVLFEEVASGTHMVYGKSIEGCGMTVKTITLIGYPKFFTPNNDGQNDRWNILGLENQPQAEIFIFDRYGKLLESLNPTANGWDGTYNGKQLPSNDYWFQVNFMENLTDGSERPQVFKSHFTLKR